MSPPTLVAGNPGSSYPVPVAGQAINTSSPAHVIGTGTPASCTGAAVVAAVAQGGMVTFNCGPNPVSITLTSTAKVFNDRPDVTLDGGGKVTLSGGGTTRILYQNTCDPAQVWTTGQCDNQASPTLTVQNLTFSNGNSTGQTLDGGGGGAILVRGGRFKIVNASFINNQCEATGADIGSGGAIYNDGNTFALQLFGSTVRDNSANEGGGAVFYVSNDRTGTLGLTNSVFARNPNAGFSTAGYPGFFILAAPGQPVVNGSTLAP